MSEIALCLKGMAVSGKEIGIGSAELITCVAINECPVREEVSPRVICQEDMPAGNFSESQWPDLHYNARVRIHNQKMTVAARAMAERKTLGHLS